MPRPGQKKTRTARAATIAASSTWSARLSNRLRNRAVLLRLALCLLAMIALFLAVEGWRVPFTFRLGDHPAHGVLARIDFTRVNRFETERARAQSESQVPYLFRHDPDLLQNLTWELRQDLEEVAAAERLESLSAETQVAFGLVPPNEVAGPVKTPEEISQVFWALKDAVAPTDDMTDARLETVLREFQSFTEPLGAAGVVDPSDLVRNRIRAGDKVAIVPEDNPQQRLVVSPADVQLREMLKDTGLLGRSWDVYEHLKPIRIPLERWLVANVPATLEFDAAATQTARRIARENVPAVTDTYHAGDVLVPAGEAINEEALAVLRAEYDQAEQLVPTEQRVARIVTVFLMLLVLAVVNGYYIVRNQPQLAGSIRQLSMYLLAIVVAVALGRALSFDPWRASIIPLIVTTMVFAIAYDQVLATLTAFTLSLILTMSTVSDIGQFVVLISTAAVAVLPLSHVPSRSTLIKVGFWAGLVYFLVSWGTGIIQSQSLNVLWSDYALLLNSLKGAGWCLAAGYFVAGSLPFVESTFGVVTDISLLEMSDVSHPLLQELVRRAPGTYNHSISVATIGESAADAIGANGLLVRVGAYYHDIGKMLKPQYFVENMTEGSESRHEHLAPAMSTLIIIGHVKDGSDLARQHNLPRPIIDFIEQHHGTTLVQYFFHEAARQADLQPDHRTDADEAFFRYPGPKPQSKEAGVMMLADAVESASRTLHDPTPKRIESLVHKITMDRLLDGQFEESSLTLTEIHTIEESLTKSLIGIYHGRIKYPEQRSA